MTVFLYLVVTLAFRKILGLVSAWKSGLKVPLLPLGPSWPLKTIKLGDLVGCDNLLKIVWPFGALYFKFKWAKRPLLSADCSHARPKSSNKKSA
jgi:hypothetical protein